MNNTEWQEGKLSISQQNKTKAQTKLPLQIVLPLTFSVSWVLYVLTQLKLSFLLCTTKFILVDPIPCFLVCPCCKYSIQRLGFRFFNQAGKENHLHWPEKGRWNLIHCFKNLPIPGPKRNTQQDFEAHLVAGLSWQAFRFCFFLPSSAQSPGCDQLSGHLTTYSLPFYQHKLMLMFHSMYFLARF